MSLDELAVKSGGTSSQFLKADGSVDSSTYITSYTETDTLNTVTNRGNSTSNGINVGVLTATSLIKSGGTSSQFLKADGFDDAIIGVQISDMRLIYSVSKCLDILVEDMDSLSDAIEYLEYNVIGGYVGEKTPIWCHDLY